jgi:oxygen-independent coproporphyrinogen-3 oxidase
MEWMQHGALGIYISIPFCRSKCTYCNFASGVYPASEHEHYVNALARDLEDARGFAEEHRIELLPTVDTIYLGGGTPSLLAPHLLRRIFDAIRERFAVAPDAEITMECAPGQIAPEVVDAMLAVGVNRVSLGVQSFIDREAHGSGRLHSRSTVLEDLCGLRAAGISNINLDLIAGLAGQTLASWDESIDVLLNAGVPHASIYMLEVDEDSRLGREMLGGGVRYGAGLVPTDEAIARMYETAIERLDRAGLLQYEISNFSRPGFESRHNLRYWQRRPYLGVGLDASSMAYEAGDANRARVLRWTTTDDLKAYLNGGAEPEMNWFSRDRQLEEAWFLGLRLNAGVKPAALEAEFGREPVAPGLEVADRLIADGLLEHAGDRIRLTPRGRLLSNDVFQEFLQSREVAAAAQKPRSAKSLVAQKAT